MIRKKINSWQELRDLAHDLSKNLNPTQPSIAICEGTGCRVYGCLSVAETLEKELTKQNLDHIKIIHTGCHGFCERGTLMVINPQGIFYSRVKPEDVTEIIEKTIKNNEIIDRLVYLDAQSGQKIPYEKDIPFYKHQYRLLLGQNQKINPTSIEDYIAHGGYDALAKALFEMTPLTIIEEVKNAGLRGRGGGGFPTGRKWESARKAEGTIKYVICNADEGDPGAYMDRSIIEGNPHSVLEGIIIGAYAVGAQQGYIYIRHEYPLALHHITEAIKQAREYGLLGENILGSDFSFDLKISRGGGAFVAGESSALIQSIEGRVAEPKAKYVHMAEHGLYNSPTVLNNVETWANVPLIIKMGSHKYSEIGTKNSTGTKIFSLVGKINNTGLVEVPMGISLRQIIFDIGGGIKNNKKFKAVQTGGPSGGVLPEKMLDLPVDFDRLTEAGSMMGSGGMIVMDEDNCMVDVAKYFISFLQEESCGKCVPCREGLKKMLEILDKITNGKGEVSDLDTLFDLSQLLTDGSLCGLGTSAANPVLSSLQYFRDEYEAHIKDKKCPAKVCKALIKFRIDPDKCTGCHLCYKNCPADAITGQNKKLHSIHDDKCIKCGICFDVCKFDAVLKE
ncbi:MAG: NADH-ubiquinone oxidoreductase-F iron-sulfur binding region domain-containing protein [candidate division WOR-3 bacterium]